MWVLGLYVQGQLTWLHLWFSQSRSLNWQIYHLQSVKGREEEGVSRAEQSRTLLECLREHGVLK